MPGPIVPMRLRAGHLRREAEAFGEAEPGGGCDLQARHGGDRATFCWTILGIVIETASFARQYVVTLGARGLVL